MLTGGQSVCPQTGPWHRQYSRHG